MASDDDGCECIYHSAWILLRFDFLQDVYKDEGAKSQLLNTAYATLLDPVKRMEYDRGIGYVCSRRVRFLRVCRTGR